MTTQGFLDTIRKKAGPPDGRFEGSGARNSMVTHRVRVKDAAQVDKELVNWLQRAFDAAR